MNQRRVRGFSQSSLLKKRTCSPSVRTKMVHACEMTLTATSAAARSRMILTRQRVMRCMGAIVTGKRKPNGPLRAGLLLAARGVLPQFKIAPTFYTRVDPVEFHLVH